VWTCPWLSLIASTWPAGGGELRVLSRGFVWSRVASSWGTSVLYSRGALIEYRPEPRLFWLRFLFVFLIPSRPYVSICVRDSAVGIATGHWMDDWGVGVRVPVGSRIFSSSRRPDRLWVHPTSYPLGTGGSLQCVNRSCTMRARWIHNRQRNINQILQNLLFSTIYHHCSGLENRN
jgi:hypothetical protein